MPSSIENEENRLLTAEEFMKQLEGMDCKQWDDVEKLYRRQCIEAALASKGYNEFLRENGINATRIDEISFSHLPIMNKLNYLMKYPSSDIYPREGVHILSSSSGSSGNTFYFPRNRQNEWQSSNCYLDFIKRGMRNGTKTCFVLNCFGMGIWIGGLIAHSSISTFDTDGLSITLASVGINKPVIFDLLNRFGTVHDQTVIIGYPPFVKDIFDEANAKGIDLSKMNIRIITAAEVYTESFRTYLQERACIKNRYLDFMNIYGSADLGTMAWETPLTILVRTLASKNPSVFKALFPGASKQPTLAQYVPSFISFEEFNDELLLTGNNSIPLVRYAIGDRGGVIKYSRLKEILESNGVDLDAEAISAGISSYSQIPMVYIYERTDFSVSLFGVKIYPYMIRDSLLSCEFLTGKFSLRVEAGDNHKQVLEVNLELRLDTEEDDYMQEVAYATVENSLLAKCSEMREVSKEYNLHSILKVRLWPFGSKEHFAGGGKQKWTK